MANHMEEVVKMLGVKLGERFEIIDNNGNKSSDIYYFTQTNLMAELDLTVSKTLYCADANILHRLIVGDYSIKRKLWKPKDGEGYYSVEPGGNVSFSKFRSGVGYTATDINYYKLGNCYRTYEEAEANQNKQVNFYALDEVLEV